MTKKDFVLIAQVLKDTRPDFSVMHIYDAYQEALMEWQLIVYRFTERLEQDNPRFQRERFLKACGYDTPEAEHA